MANVRLIDVDKAAAALADLPRCVWRDRLKAGDFDAPAPTASASVWLIRRADGTWKESSDEDDYPGAKLVFLTEAEANAAVHELDLHHVDCRLVRVPADAPAPPPAEATTIPTAIPASVAPFLRAYIRETKRPDCLPEYRFEVTLPRGKTVWRSNLTDAVAAILDAVNWPSPD